MPALGRLVLGVRQQFAQLLADRLEALAVGALRVWEGIADTAPADIARKLGLLGFGRRAAFGFDLAHQFDGADIVEGLLAPRPGLAQRTGLDDVIFAFNVGVGALVGYR